MHDSIAVVLVKISNRSSFATPALHILVRENIPTLVDLPLLILRHEGPRAQTSDQVWDVQGGC